MLWVAGQKRMSNKEDVEYNNHEAKERASNCKCFFFWCWLTWVGPDKGSLNWIVVVVLCR